MTETSEVTREFFSQTLFRISNTTVTVATVISIVIVIAVTFWGSRLIRRGLTLWFGRRGVAAEGTIHAINRLVHYVVVFSGLAVALQTLGISLGGLFAAGAVFAVGIGFAMQNIAQNFVSGVILLVERAIKKDDILRVEGELVRVRQLGIRSTIVQTRDGYDLIVPNSAIVQSTVINYTLQDSRYRARVTVGVVYHADLDLVRRTLEEVARAVAQQWGQTDREPQVVLVDFGSSSVDFQVAVWTNDPWRERQSLSELRFAVWNAFKERGITIAFPQLDVHFDAPVESSIARLAAAPDR